jgi:hypothetical protein
MLPHNVIGCSNAFLLLFSQEQEDSHVDNLHFLPFEFSRGHELVGI